MSIVVAYRFCTALIREGEEEAEEKAEEGAERIARTSSGKFCELRIRSVCGGRREGFKLNFKCKIDAQVELELCLQGQHGSKCSSRLCHTHTHTVLPCVWHEQQLPVFAFWLHCKYIFVCCLNSKSACYIYNWSIYIYICTRQIRKVYLSPCGKCVLQVCLCVCVCISGFLAAKDFPACASFAFLFPLFGRCMLPHLGTINICTVPFCIGWANNMLHLLQRRPPVSAPQAAPHIETWWSINKPLISPRQCN